MSPKLPEDVRAMYTDAYRLHETLVTMGNTPEDWLKCHQLMVETAEKHHNHPLFISLAVAITDQLERDRSGQNGS